MASLLAGVDEKKVGELLWHIERCQRHLVDRLDGYVKRGILKGKEENLKNILATVMPERPIIIGFKGPRASGKTAAINCLLGEHILPCGSTSVPMVVKYNGSGDGTYKCRVRYMSNRRRSRGKTITSYAMTPRPESSTAGLESLPINDDSEMNSFLSLHSYVRPPFKEWLISKKLVLEMPCTFLKRGTVLVDFPGNHKDEEFNLDLLVLFSKASKCSSAKWTRFMTDSEIKSMKPENVVYALTHCKSINAIGGMRHRLEAKGAIEEVERKMPQYREMRGKLSEWLELLDDERARLQVQLSSDSLFIQSFFQYHESEVLPRLVQKGVSFAAPCPLLKIPWAREWQNCHDDAQEASGRIIDASARLERLKSRMADVQRQWTNQIEQEMIVLRHWEIKQCVAKVVAPELKTKRVDPPTVIGISSKTYKMLKELPKLRRGRPISKTGIPFLRKKIIEIATECIAEKSKAFAQSFSTLLAELNSSKDQKIIGNLLAEYGKDVLEKVRILDLDTDFTDIFSYVPVPDRVSRSSRESQIDCD